MLNQSTLTGRLTKTPELKHLPENQTTVANFTIAVERDYTDENGERKVDFIPVVAWNGLAKFAAGYFGKGGSITVQGRLQSRTWNDQEGKKHYAVELQAEKLYFSGDSKKQAGEAGEEQEEAYAEA